MNTAFRDAVERLRAAGVDNPRLDARVLWEFAQKTSLSPLGGEGWGEGASPSAQAAPAHPDPLPQGGRGNALEIFEQLIARRVAREPVAYITGTKGFWSLELDVGPGALVPRPETETLVESVLAEFPDRTAPLQVLDLGTGTGCLLLSVLREYPRAHGIGIDASLEALGWARRNARKLGLANRCTLPAGNWADDLSDGFDVILSNPPYIRRQDIASLAPEIRFYEPWSALDGGPDGLDAYRALAPEIARLLNENGLAFLEMGQDQGPAIAEIMAGAGLGTRKIVPDLVGVGRCAVVEPGSVTEKTVGSPAPNR